MLSTWRIVKARHQASAFSGEGARLYGGRWTRKGRRAIYTSATVALATLEMLVQLEHPAILSSYVFFPVDIPDDQVESLEESQLPPDWRAYPAPAALQMLGDAWLDAGKRPVLRVPSVIVPSEFNYLLNPEHRRFDRIAVGDPHPFSFDPRLASP